MPLLPNDKQKKEPGLLAKMISKLKRSSTSAVQQAGQGEAGNGGATSTTQLDNGTEQLNTEADSEKPNSSYRSLQNSLMTSDESSQAEEVGEQVVATTTMFADMPHYILDRVAELLLLQEKDPIEKRRLHAKLRGVNRIYRSIVDDAYFLKRAFDTSLFVWATPKIDNPLPYMYEVELHADLLAPQESQAGLHFYYGKELAKQEGILKPVADKPGWVELEGQYIDKPNKKFKIEFELSGDVVSYKPICNGEYLALITDKDDVHLLTVRDCRFQYTMNYGPITDKDGKIKTITRTIELGSEMHRVFQMPHELPKVEYELPNGSVRMIRFGYVYQDDMDNGIRVNSGEVVVIALDRENSENNCCITKFTFTGKLINYQQFCDNRYLAFAVSRGDAPNCEGEWHIIDTLSGEHRIKSIPNLWHFDVSPDGKYFVAAILDGPLKRFRFDLTLPETTQDKTDEGVVEEVDSDAAAPKLWCDEVVSATQMSTQPYGAYKVLSHPEERNINFYVRNHQLFAYDLGKDCPAGVLAIDGNDNIRDYFILPGNRVFVISEQRYGIYDISLKDGAVTYAPVWQKTADTSKLNLASDKPDIQLSLREDFCSINYVENGSNRRKLLLVSLADGKVLKDCQARADAPGMLRSGFSLLGSRLKVAGTEDQSPGKVVSHDYYALARNPAPGFGNV